MLQRFLILFSVDISINRKKYYIYFFSFNFHFISMKKTIVLTLLNPGLFPTVFQLFTLWGYIWCHNDANIFSTNLNKRYAITLVDVKRQAYSIVLYMFSVWNVRDIQRRTWPYIYIDVSVVKYTYRFITVITALIEFISTEKRCALYMYNFKDARAGRSCASVLRKLIFCL